jgi:hypothetical protein
VRVVFVLAGAVVGCRVTGSLGVSIVAGIDHLVVGSIVSHYRRRTSCGGSDVSGCRDDVKRGDCGSTYCQQTCAGGLYGLS